MSSASEQLLYAINSLTEVLSDLTGLLTEVIAEEYEPPVMRVVND